MKAGADILCTPPACRMRHLPADPCKASEIGETLKTVKRPKTVKTVKTRKSVKTARKRPHAPASFSDATLTLPRWRVAASTDVALSRKREKDIGACVRLPLLLAGSNREAVRRWGEGSAVATARETLKHETLSASRGGAETVKHAPGRRCGIALRTRRETLKQRRKTQTLEGLRCFRPTEPAGFPETLSCRSDTTRETVKHPPAPLRRTAHGPSGSGRSLAIGRRAGPMARRLGDG